MAIHHSGVGNQIGQTSKEKKNIPEAKDQMNLFHISLRKVSFQLL